MAKLNLLPWRESRRKERQQEFLVVLGFACAVTAILVFYTNTHIGGMIEYQKSRNQFLQNEINLLNRKIKEIKELESTKKALLDRMKIIQTLQVSRPGVVHLFDELVRTLPEGIYLTNMTQVDNQLQISGRAESNARISSYMRNLNNSEWMTNPQLIFIETSQGNNNRYSDFQLIVNQTVPGQETDEEEDR